MPGHRMRAGFFRLLTLHCVWQNNNGRVDMKVSEILKVKVDFPYTVTPGGPLEQAIATMAEKDIGSLVVMEFGELVGMLTFREVVKAVHANQGVVGNGTVRRHM